MHSMVVYLHPITALINIQETVSMSMRAVMNVLYRSTNLMGQAPIQ